MRKYRSDNSYKDEFTGMADRLAQQEKIEDMRNIIISIIAIIILFGVAITVVIACVNYHNEQEIVRNQAVKAYKENLTIYKFIKFVDENPQRFDIDYSLDPDSGRYIINWGVTSFTVTDKDKNTKYSVKLCNNNFNTLKMWRNGIEIGFSDNYFANIQLVRYFTDVCKRNSQYYRDIEANQMLQDINEPVTVITSSVTDSTIQINVNQNNQNKKNIELNTN